MKLLTTLAICLLASTGWGQYHIRVECFSSDSYQIVFTPDNWVTRYPIREAFDISGEYTGNDVVYNPMLFQSGLDYDNPKAEAVKFAKRFNTLSKAFKWNWEQKNIYLQLLANRKKHPIIKKPSELTAKKQCCTVTQIY